MNKKSLIIVGFISSVLIAICVLFYFTHRVQASPSMVIDSTLTSATQGSSHRRVIRTSNGTGGNRVFVVASNGTDNSLLYSDDPEASSPTWNSVGTFGASMGRVSMVWDESNNVIYLAYGRNSPSNNNNSDIYYRQVTALGTTPVLGTERIALNGTAGSITYHVPEIEIAQDSGTTKVFVFGNRGSSGTAPTGWDVAVGTLNSDNPTWGTYNAKTWTTSTNAGLMGVARSSTNKLVVMYYDGTQILATRHDDATDAEASSGWDDLSGTDNSATTLSTDDPTARALGSVVGMSGSDLVWFGWQDGSNDINTIRWNGSTLDTELVPVALGSAELGPSLTSDGVTLYLLYRSDSDATQLVYQTRSATDGTTAWGGTKIILDDTAESVSYISSAKKLYQGKLDVIYTTQVSSYVRHASSYKISGHVYQESASAPYEGTTVWSGCDGSTLSVAVSVAGGAKQNTWCSSSDGAYYFVLSQPSGADQDITLFLDTGAGDQGAHFTHNPDTLTDVIDQTIYKNKILLSSESSSPITNADINSFDQTDDADIPAASTGTDLTIDAGFELHVNSGETFAPGGNVTIPKLHLLGTYTGSTETLTLSGSGSSSTCDDTVANIRPLCLDSGTFTPTSNLTLFTGSSASLIQNTTYHTLHLEPAGNSITHTLMAGTTTVGDNLTLGNGSNTGVTITAATGSTTLTVIGSLTISSNTTFIANGSNATSVSGNWTKTGSFTHSSGTVILDGADSSTQILTGNTTFYNLTASTSGGSTGRTLQFTGSSTTTVSGTWTVTGFSGKVITLQSSDTNSWTITPSISSIDYTTIARSSNTVGTICATHSTDGGNNSGWNISSGASCGSPPTAPTFPYAEGVSNPSSIVDLTPEFSAIHNDPDADAANFYEININTLSDFTGTIMWNTGAVSIANLSSGARSTDVSYAGTALSYNGTTYYWRIRFTDTGGAVGTWSATQNFSTNLAPITPSLDSPTDASSNQSLTPTLLTTTTDPDSNYLRYKIELCENLGMTTNCQTFDQTVSQTGWSGQNAETSTAYTSGTQGNYTLQTPLALATTYYWRSYAIDPGGTNTWTGTQTPFSFTTISVSTSDLYLQGVGLSGINFN